MPNPARPHVSASSQSQTDHNFAPDFAWSIVGGLITAGVFALLYTLLVTWGGLRLDLALPVGEVVPLSAYPRELAGVALGGALVILLIRGIRLQTR